MERCVKYGPVVRLQDERNMKTAIVFLIDTYRLIEFGERTDTYRRRGRKRQRERERERQRQRKNERIDGRADGADGPEGQTDIRIDGRTDGDIWIGT